MMRLGVALLAGLLAMPLLGGSAMADGISALVEFQSAPFPYRGPLPDGSGPFLDVERDGRVGHTSPRGGIYWEDETYSDRRVLLSVPDGFDASQPGLIVVFFHGNEATLERDVVKRQKVPQQLAASGLNGVLVAPQLAVDALDSSAGGFWQSGSLSRFLDEAAANLAALTGAPASSFASMPVVIVAYSGGYNPAAYGLERGGLGNRIIGTILLDAAFGESDKFARWAAGTSGFFVSAYGEGSAAGNAEIMTRLTRSGTAYTRGAPDSLSPGTLAFIGSNANHAGFVTSAFVDSPLAWLLGRIPDYRR